MFCGKGNADMVYLTVHFHRCTVDYMGRERGECWTCECGAINPPTSPEYCYDCEKRRPSEEPRLIPKHH